jgi:hypothetical protein
MDTIEIPARQAAEPVMKTKRHRSVSRGGYPKSDNLDRTIDHCIEYELDSRRLGPHLLRIEEIRSKLEDARARFETARRECSGQRVQFEEIRQDREGHLDETLKNEMLDYGSHVPTTIPMEFSKFSSKVLDTRERQRKSAWFRQYDEAEALRKDAHTREKGELEVLTAKFARSYKLQKQEVVRKQTTRKDVFKQHWQRKKDEEERIMTQRLTNLKKAVEHWERDLAQAEGAAGAEYRRIKTNERMVSTPIDARQAATFRRF